MFVLRDTVEIDESGFWNLFFDEEFMRALHRELHDTSFVAEQRTDEDGALLRRVDYQPKVPELPSFVTKLIGDGSYVETGRFDPRSRTYVATFAPKKGADSFSSVTELRVEASGERRCERVLTITNSVNVFGVGRLIAAAAEREQRRGNLETIKFMNQWIRARAL